MKTPHIQPNIPAPLSGEMSAEFAETYFRLQSAPLPDIRATMPSLRTDSDAEIEFGVLNPNADFDEKVAMIKLGQFASGMSVSQGIHDNLLVGSQQEPKRLLDFPNNAIGGRKHYRFDEEERDVLVNGDFSPLTSRVSAAIRNMGVESVHIIGYSQGAGTGAALARRLIEEGDIEVNSLTLGDPANVVDRSELELSKAVMMTGFSSMARAVRDSAIPALSEAMQIEANARIKAGRMGRFVFGGLISENIALRRALTHNTFFDDVLTVADKDIPITVMRAEKSRVFPRSVFVAARDTLQEAGVNLIEVSKYGHEANHNAPASVSLANLALQPA